MRCLAIDLGDKRTGIAVGDDETGIVSPAGLIEIPMPADPAAGGSLADALAAAIAEHDAQTVILGLPLNMDDSEGPRARLVRTFAAALGARTDATIVLQDERLTSADADWTMAQSGLTRGQKKRRRDALAAAAILRDYLASSG